MAITGSVSAASAMALRRVDSATMPPATAQAPTPIAAIRAASAYSIRSFATGTAATRMMPNAVEAIAAARDARRLSNHLHATKSATGAMRGRTYCGRLDCESEKKTNGIANHRSRYLSSHRGPRSAVRGPRETAAKHHGNAPPIRNGMKYQGGPVRFSSPLASRPAVSVNKT